MDALARSQPNDQALDLPSTRIPDNPHPFGILNSVHLRRLAGRDAQPPTAMQPAMPARVTRRNDFPTVKAAKAAAGSSRSSNNNNQNNSSSSSSTPAGGPAAMDRGQLNELVHRVMKPTFPPHLEGVVETRHQSDAKMTEDLKGFDDVEGMIGAKVEYGKKYRAFRGGFSAAEAALARKAREARAARGVAAGEVRKAHHGRRDSCSEEDHAGVKEGLVARVEDMHSQLRALAAHMGFMFALGRAVDQAVLPGENFGRFDEMECSPKAYLSFYFPEFVRRPVGPVDPMTPELLPPHLLPLFFPVWDFSLEELLRGEKRARLRALWEAAVVGDWEAAREMTRGKMVVAEELVAVAVGVGGGGGGGDDEDGIESV